MGTINEVIEIIKNLTPENALDIWIAVAIAAVFSIFRGTLAYIVVKMFNFKEKKSKVIKNNAFYDPLKTLFSFLGLYLAILFLGSQFSLGEDIINGVTKIFKIIVIITMSIALGNSLTTKSSFILKIQEKSDKDYDKGTLKFIVKAIKTVIYVIAAFMVIMELGYNLSGLITGLGIGSVVITLAAQDTAKNLFGGLVIILDKPFKIGDTIIVGTGKGTVEDISFRSTKIRTADNNVIYIPNSTIAANSVTNCSEKTTYKYHNIISLDKDTNLPKVEKCKYEIVKMLMANKIIIEETIVVRIIEISQGGIDFEIACQVDTEEATKFAQVKEDINYEILQILNDENAKLVSNSQTVIVK